MVPFVIEPAGDADLDQVTELLRASELPLAGVSDCLETLMVARTYYGRGIIGCAALELYPPFALLRSVAVAEPFRKTGIGTPLTQAALDLARRRNVEAVYLLTTTAPNFFARVGFEVIARSLVPEPVQRSQEFTSICPESAVVMVRRL